MSSYSRVHSSRTRSDSRTRGEVFCSIRTQMLWYALRYSLFFEWLGWSNSEIHQWTIHLQMCQNVATNSSYSIASRGCGHLMLIAQRNAKQSVPSITPSRSFNIYYGTKVFTAFIMGGPIRQDKSNHYYWLSIKEEECLVIFTSQL